MTRQDAPDGQQVETGNGMQFVDGNEVARHTSVVDQLQDLNVGQQLEVLEFAFIRPRSS